MAFWNKDNNGSQTLSDLIRGLQHSVNAAMEMIETRNIELLGRYFTEDGVPLKKRIWVDDKTAVDVPLISMAGKPIRAPRKKITPYIDGTKSIFSDNWKDAGCIFLPDSPTFSHRKLVKGICYGFDDDNLYFKIEINKTNTKHYKDILCQIFIYIQNHNNKYRCQRIIALFHR